MANLIGERPTKFLLMRLNRVNQKGRAKAAKIQEALRADARVSRPDEDIQVAPSVMLVSSLRAIACHDPKYSGRVLPAGYRDDTTPKH